jgi:hypothetical protein
MDETADEEITAMVSRELERVDFIKSIFPHDYKGNVEQWLLELEIQMKLSMQHVMAEGLQDFYKSKDKRTKWIGKW